MAHMPNQTAFHAIAALESKSFRAFRVAETKTCWV